MASGERPPIVTLGRVVGVHGLRGALRVRPMGDDPSHLFEVPSVRLGSSEEDPEARAYAVARALPGRKGEVRLELAEVTSREDAETLGGAWVSVSAEDLAPLPEGEYYAYELVGCRVVDREGNEIGVVREIWSPGAHDILVVAEAGGTDQLIPTAPEIMREVDLVARRITVEVLPGLLIDRGSE